MLYYTSNMYYRKKNSPYWILYGNLLVSFWCDEVESISLQFLLLVYQSAFAAVMNNPPPPPNFSGSQKQLFLTPRAVALLGMTGLTEFILALLSRQVFKFLEKSQRSSHSLGYALLTARCQGSKRWENRGKPCKCCKASALSHDLWNSIG